MEQYHQLSNNAIYLHQERLSTILLSGNITLNKGEIFLDELLECPLNTLFKAHRISAESVCDFVTVSSRAFWVTWRPDDELVLLTGLRSGLDVVDFVTGLVFTVTAPHSCLCFLPSAWLSSACTPVFDNVKDFLHLLHWASLSVCAGTSQSLNLSIFHQANL